MLRTAAAKRSIQRPPSLRTPCATSRRQLGCGSTAWMRKHGERPSSARHSCGKSGASEGERPRADAQSGSIQIPRRPLKCRRKRTGPVLPTGNGPLLESIRSRATERRPGDRSVFATPWQQREEHPSTADVRRPAWVRHVRGAPMPRRAVCSLRWQDLNSKLTQHAYILCIESRAAHISRTSSPQNDAQRFWPAVCDHRRLHNIANAY